MKLKLCPLDYEKFLWATGNETYRLLKDFYDKKTPIGNSVNRKLMRDFRMYMAVGGMPQAVQAYLEKKSFIEIDEVKRNIIRLYEDDFRKIDASGLSSRIYKDVPSQLSKNKKRKEDSDAERRKIAYAFKAIREESGMSRNNFFIAGSLSLQIDCRQEKDHAFRFENLKSSWGFMKREMLLRSEIN